MTKTSKITYTAIFAAIATVLMYFEFPIPFMPPFLKVDLSGAVVLIGAFIFGIAPAITMIGIKDIIHLTQTMPPPVNIFSKSFIIVLSNLLYVLSTQDARQTELFRPKVPSQTSVHA